jgi:hypothetical protein
VHRAVLYYASCLAHPFIFSTKVRVYVSMEIHHITFFNGK